MNRTPDKYFPRDASYRELVYEALEYAIAGMTDEELVDHTELPANTCRPRRVELVSEGRVVDSGRKRQTRSGRMAIIWKVAA
jgi:hypothetical protein